MRRHGLFWYVGECDAVPWWLGFVRRYELKTQCTVVPLNLAAAFWLWFLDGVRYRFLPRGVRFRENRRALRQAFERGREVGERQGRVYGACDEQARLAKFTDEYFRLSWNQRTARGRTSGGRDPR